MAGHRILKIHQELLWIPVPMPDYFRPLMHLSVSLQVLGPWDMSLARIFSICTDRDLGDSLFQHYPCKGRFPLPWCGASRQLMGCSIALVTLLPQVSQVSSFYKVSISLLLNSSVLPWSLTSTCAYTPVALVLCWEAGECWVPLFNHLACLSRH